MSYRLATYQSADGPRAAIIVGERVIDAAKGTRANGDVSVIGILADWTKARPRLEALATRQGVRGQPLSKVKLLSPLPLPGAVYCAGSNYGDHAAEMAVSLARLHGAALTGMYVVDPYPYLGIGEAEALGFEAYMNAAREHATLALSRLADLCDRQQPPLALDQRIVEDVSAVEGIVRSAAEEGCDLIIVGSHGRSGLSRLMLGSVASKVVAQSPVPVLVAR